MIFFFLAHFIFRQVKKSDAKLHAKSSKMLPPDTERNNSDTRLSNHYYSFGVDMILTCDTDGLKYLSAPCRRPCLLPTAVNTVFVPLALARVCLASLLAPAPFSKTSHQSQPLLTREELTGHKLTSQKAEREKKTSQEVIFISY